MPPAKLHIERDVLERFRQGGKGYQTRMNKVLRAFVKSRQVSSIGKGASRNRSPYRSWAMRDGRPRPGDQRGTNARPRIAQARYGLPSLSPA